MVLHIRTVSTLITNASIGMGTLIMYESKTENSGRNVEKF